jgi:manganese/zinc/iron transport system substrate-binding protein
MSKSSAALAGVLALAVALAGCGQPVGRTGPPDVSGRKAKAVATTGMVGDLVREIGGERVEVTALMGPGVDPHLYKASEGDVLALADADVIFFNGLHLEAKMADVLERIEGRLMTAAVTDGIPRDRLVSSPQFSGAYDPHVWFDVSLWIEAGEKVRETLIRLDPAHAEVYRRNADRYQGELERLHAEVRELAASVPPEQRVLVTAHDAFGYFGRAYGFEVRGLQGISTASEAGAADVQRLADFIAERRIRAIFVESSVPQQTIRAVQEAVRSRGWEVEIGGQLFSDAMGDPGTPEGTYPGMVRSNVETIVEALRDER